MTLNVFIGLGMTGLGVVGFGVILHYYAFAIAWGVRKGMAKIPTNNIHNVVLKTEKE